jgi:hypothetical protein
MIKTPTHSGGMRNGNTAAPSCDSATGSVTIQVPAYASTKKKTSGCFASRPARCAAGAVPACVPDTDTASVGRNAFMKPSCDANTCLDHVRVMKSHQAVDRARQGTGMGV